MSLLCQLHSVFCCDSSLQSGLVSAFMQEQELQEQLAAVQKGQGLATAHSEQADVVAQLQTANQLLQQRDQDMAAAMQALQHLQQQVQDLATAAEASGFMQQQQQVQEQLVQLQVVLRRASSTGEELFGVTAAADGIAGHSLTALEQQLQAARDEAAAELAAAQDRAAAQLSAAEAQVAELREELQQLKAEAADRALQVGLAVTCACRTAGDMSDRVE